MKCRFAIALGVVTVTAVSVSAAVKPNIILFLVDDMGLMDTSVPFIAGPDGNPRKHALNDWYRTPSMERLAKRGIRFSDFYAHTVCSPTRASIMTGQNSARHRVTNFISPERKNTGANGAEEWNWSGLSREDVTLPGLLRKAGYRTIHVGKAHFGPVNHEGEEPLNLGFDVNIAGCAYGQPGSYFGEDGYGNLNPKRKKRAVPGLEKYHKTDTFLSEALTIEAKTAIDQSIDEKKPFFLCMSHYAVHSPFQSDKRFANHYAESDKKKPAKAFATLVAGMDKSLGDLMNHVETKGIADNTVMFFLGDNGSDAPLGGDGDIASSAPLRGKKGSKWEGGIRVPFIAAWMSDNPKNRWQQRMPIKAGGFQRQLGACFDLFPTITELAEAGLPGDLSIDGHSLATLLSGKRDSDRQEIFLSHFPHPRRDKHFTTYRDGDWKLIYHYLPTGDVKRYSLFNLKADPTESKNVALQNPKLLKRLTQAMANQLADSDALYPLVDGKEIKPIIP